MRLLVVVAVCLGMATAKAEVASHQTSPPPNVGSHQSTTASSATPTKVDEQYGGVTFLVGAGFVHSRPRVGSWVANGPVAAIGVGWVVIPRVELSLQGQFFLAVDQGVLTFAGSHAAIKLLAYRGVWFEGTGGFATTTGCGDQCTSQHGRTLGALIGFAPDGRRHSVTLGASTLITDTSFGLHTFAVAYRYQWYAPR
jgi:hypothetical protein